MSIQKHKLWLKGFCPQRTDEEIREFCDRFGKTLHMARPRARDYVFLTYGTEEEALEAQANFVRDRFYCNFAIKNPKHDAINLSQSKVSTPDRQQSESPPNKNNKRVHFSSDVVTQQIKSTSSSTTSSQQSNRAVIGTTTPNNVATSPPKTVFRNGDKIIITHVQSAASFYAHPVSKDNERRELLEQISKLAKTIDCVQKPEKLRMALAPYKRDYYRAILKGQPNTLSDKVLVTLVDVGVSLQVPFKMMKPIPDEYTKIRITTRFSLDGIDDDANQSYGAACLESYIGEELKMKCDGEFAERLASVRLFHPNSRQSINGLLKEMQRTFNSDELIRTAAPIGKNKIIVPVDDSKLADGCNVVTFIDANNLPEFNQQWKRIQALGNRLRSYPPFKPTEVELCLVMYAGNWHRALFVEQELPCVNDNDDVCVMLIDLCKGVTINPKAIRNITIDIVHMPILAFIAALNGYDKEIDKTIVAKIIHKFKAMNTMRVKSIYENSDTGLYTIDI